jgi:hypothetical protein
MRVRAVVAAGLATLALCGVAAAADWTAVASLGATEQVTFAQPALGFAADGRGALVWDSYPDLRTYHYGALSASGVRREAIRLPFAITAMAALPGGRAFVLGAPAGAPQVDYALLGPGARVSRRPEIGAYFPSDRAVVAANAAGTLAILGEGGGRAFLTVCGALARCGATQPLTGSQGTVGETGVAGQPGLAVAIGRDGSVLAAFVHDGRLWARWREPGGRLAPLQQLATLRSQTWLSAAISRAGTAEIAWETQAVRDLARPGPAISVTTVAAAQAAPGGRFGPPLTLDRFPASPSVRGPSDVALDAPAVVAAAFDGARPLVAWTGHTATGFDVRAAVADGRAGATTQTLSDPSASAALGALATAPGRGSVVAWSSPAGVQAALAPPGQLFAAATTLPASLGFDAFYARPVAAAIDPRTGNAWVAGVVDGEVRLWRAG